MNKAWELSHLLGALQASTATAGMRPFRPLPPTPGSPRRQGVRALALKYGQPLVAMEPVLRS